MIHNLKRCLFIPRNLSSITCILFCLTLNFPAFSVSPSRSYYYLEYGRNIAEIKKCNVVDDATLQKSINCIAQFISYEDVNSEIKDEMTREFYRGMSFVPQTVTSEQCKKAQDTIQRFTKFCKVQ